MFRKDAQPASKLWVPGSNPGGITIAANLLVINRLAAFLCPILSVFDHNRVKFFSKSLLAYIFYYTIFALNF